MNMPVERVSALTGAVSVLLLMGALILEGTPPPADAPTGEVVQYYAGQESRLLVGTVVASLAAATLLWFGGYLYAIFRVREDETGQVAGIAFGGFILATVGHTMLFGFVLAAVETVGEVTPEVTQTLGVLAALFIVPLATGTAVAMLASAVAILRHSDLPSWLGIVTIVILAAAAISCMFGAYIAVIAWVVASMGWVLLMSVVVVLRTTPSRRVTMKDPSM